MTWAQRRRRRGERMALRLLENAGRECGDCQACCELLGIQDTQSPAGEKCRHQFDGGCAVHGTSEQPKECRHFGCAWRWGMPGGDELRPDVCGLMVLPPAPAPEDGKVRWEAAEVRPYALAAPEALHCLRTAARVHACPGVVVLHGTAGKWPGGTSAIWPASALVEGVLSARTCGVTEADFLLTIRDALALRYAELGAELVRRREAGERDGDLPRLLAEAEADQTQAGPDGTADSG